MNKRHRHILALQARLADRVVARFVIKKVPFEPECDLYQECVAANNRRWNVLPSKIPSLTAGQKSALIRKLVRIELKDTHSYYCLVDWANCFTIKDTMFTHLKDAGWITAQAV